MHHVVVHAHCYQPPREDPWLEVVETEPSAAPDHDWNARINRECYARLAATELRVRDPRASANDPDAHAGLARIVNLYAWCTFDVGATLCEWMDEQAPATLHAMIAGDRASVARVGHGNAIAAPYHHVILPLASPRDRRTEVRWGIKDFTRRFGRSPEGMWLPECAVDEDTLDLLAAEGIRFTILAPYQIRTSEEHHGLPVKWTGRSGRSISILPYDGGLAGEVAFGGLLRDAAALTRRLVPNLTDGQDRCTTLATDGETFGHHHRNGERTLAASLAQIAARQDAHITNAASIVASHPATLEATLVSPSAWSCAHGIERWRSNCGCRIDGSKPPAQEWRGPLRVALESVRDRAAEQFAREATTLFTADAWDARDQYGDVVAFDGDVLASAVRAMVRTDATDADVTRARELLEMQRASLRMFTSCAWFFDEVDRIETRQVLRYAARTLELMHASPEQINACVAQLANAHAASASNAPMRSAADVWKETVWPETPVECRVAAGATALHASGMPSDRIGTFDVTVEETGRKTSDNDGESVHRVAHVTHRRTGARSEWRTGAVIEHAGGAPIASTASQSGFSAGQPFDVISGLFATHELPESVARALLLPWSMHPSALGD